ncbi:MAG: L-aspartate oxidase [Bacteroidota bacterium]
MIQTDFLIIGSGIAGLTTAIKLAEQFTDKKVIVITKADESESNTKYAQGGIAVVLDDLTDSFEKHIEDTIKAGGGLNDRKVVEMVIKEGPDRLKELIEWGAHFDLDQQGNIQLGREGGHTQHRIVHHKDITGFELEQTLLKKITNLENAEVHQYYFSIDLITEHQLYPDQKPDKTPLQCFGAYVMNINTSKIQTIVSRFTILATGGVGQTYQTTTNPRIATGDGVAIAYRAKAHISDMEFIQFHPTALFEPGVSPAFLISEAVRGYGAYLRNKEEKRFVFDYDDRGELASRDIVAKAIDTEIKKSGEECVYLDCRHLDIDDFKIKFPNINARCEENGIFIEKDMIPVVPAAHYLCGGVDVDMDGQTTINNLYACGEVSNTGLHGANRLASNSLLEAIVYADKIAKHITQKEPSVNFCAEVPEWNEEGTHEPRELVLINHTKSEVQQTMSKFVGIVRSDHRLIRADKRNNLWFEETKELYDTTKLSAALCELRNLISVSYLIIQQSMQRKENVGGFYKLEFDKTNNNQEV